MTDKSRHKEVLDFITDHPSCNCVEIYTATKISRTAVAVILTRLAKDRLVIRQKVKHLYRYRAVRKKAEAQPEPVNMSAMFNTLLRSVRESRA